MSFILRKIVSRLFFPVPLIAILGLVALVAAWRNRRRVALISGTMALVLYLVAGCAPLADALLWQLERQYAEKEVIIEINATSESSVIVVLGSGHVNRPSLPAVVQLGPSGRARVARGVSLAQDVPDATVIFTGGSITDANSTVPIAIMAATAAVELGLSDRRVVTLPEPLDTRSEAQSVAQWLQDASHQTDTMYLITSASHMPRAHRLFQNQPGLAGVTIRPVVAEVRADAGPYTLWSWLPSAQALEKTTTVVYEALGLVWMLVTGY